VTASDFTVEIRGIPKTDMNQMEFKAYLWEWIESMTKKKGEHMECPDTQTSDENQDRLMQLTFGLSDFGRIRYLQDMRDIYKKEKAIQRAITAYPDKKYEYQDDQLTLNQKRNDLIKTIEDYDRMHSKQDCVVAFA
jgi:hypothetical protein